MRIIDRICDFLAVLASIYLMAIMSGIMFNATARTLGYSGSSHIFTIAASGLLVIAIATSPRLTRRKGHVFIDRLCDYLAVLTSIYLAAIMSGIVFNATARIAGYSGSSHFFTFAEFGLLFIFTFTEFGLLFIALATSPWLTRRKGDVFIDRLCDFLAVLAGIYLVAMMFGIVFNAMARTLGYSGSSHIFTFAEFGLLYIAMAASPWLARHKGHVFIEIVTAAMPAALQRPFSRAVSALCVIICLVLVWYTWGATVRAYGFGDAEMRSLDMPKFLLLGAMPICFALMAAQFARFVFGRETLHSGEAGVHE